MATRHTAWRRICLLVPLLLLSLFAPGAIYGDSSGGGKQPVAHAATSSDWATYNYDLAGSGDNTAETTLQQGNFSQLTLKWTAHGASGISAQPIAVGNVVYWGSWDGNLHATTITGTNAGKNLWSVNLGVTTGGKGCNPRTIGIGSTAAYGTIGTTPVVYIGGGGNDTTGGGHDYIYAVNATNGAIIWKTVIGSAPDDFAWSSPVVYKGSVFYGVASLADCPLTRGRMLKLDATTGKQQAIFFDVPSGCVAGGIWGAPSIDSATDRLYVPTGTPTPSCRGKPGDYSMSLLELNTADLSYVASWQVPASQESKDGDFGSVPTLFTATIGGQTRAMVGVANKNGIFYAFDRTNIAAGPVWEKMIALSKGGPQSGGGSIAPAVWDGKALYVAGGNTTISGASCKGSVRALNPASGAFIWESCLTGPVLGSLAAIPGVVVAMTGTKVLALNAATGQTLFSHTDSSGKVYWAPASIANGYLFAANMDSSLAAFSL